MTVSPRAAFRYPGLLAALAFTAAVAGFGGALDGYSQLVHPVALLGAHGVRRAAGFNLIGFVLPGLLAAWAAWASRSRLPRGSVLWPRLGWSLALLSALAFAAQGVFPLDPADLDAPASRRHALCWMAWWIAFVPAGLLLAVRVQAPTRVPIEARWHALAAACVFVLVAVAPAIIGSAIAQRAAAIVWMMWVACATWAPRQQGAARRTAEPSRGGS